MVKSYLVILYCGILSGCSLIRAPTTSNKFVMEPVWVNPTDQPDQLGFRLQNRMSPLLYKDRVIQGNGFNNIGAYRRDNGELIWKFSLDSGVEGGAIIDSDRLYFGSGDGKFYALRADSGTLLWSYEVGSQVLAAPVLNGNLICFLASNNSFHCLDALTGNQNWGYSRVDSSHFSIRGGTTPVVYRERLYFGSNDGYLVCLDRLKGSLIWELPINDNKRFRDVDASPVIDSGRLYISSFDNALYSINPDDGKIFWKLDEGGYFPVTIVGNQLFYATTTGKLMALDKMSGQVHWTVNLKESLATRPIFYRGLLIVGLSDGPLLAVDILSGKALGKYHTGRGLLSPPTIDIDSGELFVISNQANLYAFRLGWKRQ